VSSSDDNPNEHKTQLPLELNPLTSPLLSQNMGRWAEVYFTSPPEKREQAIQDLLRELGGDTALAGNPVSGNVAGEQGSSAGDDPVTSIAASGPVPWSEIGAATNGEQEAAPEPTSDTDRLLAPIEPSTDGALGWARGNQQVADPSRLFLDHPSTHRRNRVLTTAALVILVGTLFYVGWRETTAWLRIHAAPRSAAPETRSATARPSPPAAAWTGTSGVSAAASIDRTASSTQNGASSRKPDTGANSATAGSSKKELLPRNPADEKPNQAPANLTPANQPTQNQTARNPGSGNPGSGADELAEAESYLNGTDGKPRDSGEAAQWLWKSVAKQNAVATMLLSDLYVRGEGVPKNCDQARLLLDAAARKGLPGAGERIRSLPSMGCP
jgi:hypothetical protein